MANLFGFGTYGGILGHYIKFHLECSTLFKWFDWFVEFNEEDNSVRILIEFLKVQIYMAISSNIQDVYNFTHESYFIRQERLDEMPQYIEQEEYNES